MIWFNEPIGKMGHVTTMKISDFTCSGCGSCYEVAESVSAQGNPGRAECTVCGGLLESWREPRMKAFRLILAPEHKYPRMAVPPSPMYR